MRRGWGVGLAVLLAAATAAGDELRERFEAEELGAAAALRPSDVLSANEAGACGRPPLCWAEIVANVPDADVYIDGKDRGAAGRTPYMGDLKPGPHSITVAKEGYGDQTQSLEVEAGRPPVLTFELTPAPIGFLHVTGDAAAGGRVDVDGKRACEAAPCRVALDLGPRRVRVTRPGANPLETTVVLRKLTQSDLAVDLRPRRSRGGAWQVAAGGVFGGGCIALGVVAADRGSSAATAAAVAAGMAATGLVVWGITRLLDHGPPSTATVEERPLD